MKQNRAAFFTLALAAGLIALGIWQKLPGQVLAKAIRVCMVCVGIG